MIETTIHVCCPYIGLDNERTVILEEPTPDHRCFAQRAPFAPDFARQEAFCLGAGHTNCSFYAPVPTQNIPLYYTGTTHLALGPYSPPPTLRPQIKPRHWLSTLRLVSIGLSICLILILVTADLQGLLPWRVSAIQNNQAVTALPSMVPPAMRSVTLSPLNIAAQITATPTPTMIQTATSTPTITPMAGVEHFGTPTAEPEGQIFSFRPKGADVGWWQDKDIRRNHVGDSYLYAGAYGGETFISAMRFDLTKVPRGAPIHQAQLRLTGLRQDQFQPDVAGIWLIQLVPESSLAALGPADFLTMLSAPAAITLLPPLEATDLGVGRVNQWDLDATTRQWLEKQLLDGATSVTVRIQASIEQGAALFAWDSGLGSESAGNAPTLQLSLGPPPPTPPPLPTKPVIIATLTSVPQDVLTVVAMAQTATTVALTTGTYTPVPYAIVTPTPFPANLETVQAVAIELQLPPVVLHTPTPANALLATRDAAYATAVAQTTGTFTPVPTDYATPMLIAPSPPAENLATEAARIVAATTVANSGAPTPTPLPYNAVIGVYVYATQVSQGAEAAFKEAVIATAAAQVNGTPTPLPWNALVITPIPTLTPTSPPTATPLPLLQLATELTATPIPVNPTNVPGALPGYLYNKILFKTNRGGTEETYAIDPSTGELYRINESWIYELAEAQMAFAPDGKRKSIVKQASDRTLQIHIHSVEYQSTRQITALTGEDIGRSAVNYDPAWSPKEDVIVFVSTNSGNDEIFTVTADGAVVKQLTNNRFEWDKHPSWSPDGKQIVFFSNRETGRRQLWIMNADGSNQRNFSNTAYEDWNPVWVH